MPHPKEHEITPQSIYSRRHFLMGAGAAAAATMLQVAQADSVPIEYPGPAWLRGPLAARSMDASGLESTPYRVAKQ